MGARCLPKQAVEVVVDLDAMGLMLRGQQEGRHYSAYYGHYCCLPLYAFVGDIPLWAQWRGSDKDGAAGVAPALEKIVPAIRKRCRKARIIVRGDSGFCREEIMVWCEAQPQVYYCLGLARNPVLIEKLDVALAEARAGRCEQTILSAQSYSPRVRVFSDFEYQTCRNWSRLRRVLCKAEVMAAGDNPRFVVTNLPAPGFKGDKDGARFSPQRLYEEFYGARGEMENVLNPQLSTLNQLRAAITWPATHCGCGLRPLAIC